MAAERITSINSSSDISQTFAPGDRPRMLELHRVSRHDSKVQSFCGGLKLSIKPPEGAHARMKFQTAAASHILHPTNMPVHVGKSRLKYQTLPY